MRAHNVHIWCGRHPSLLRSTIGVACINTMVDTGRSLWDILEKRLENAVEAEESLQV